MKKLLMIAVAVLTLVACSKTQQYKVAVLFPDDTTEGQTAYLTSYDNGDTLAQAEIKNKNVVIEGEVEGSFTGQYLKKTLDSAKKKGQIG